MLVHELTLGWCGHPWGCRSWFGLGSTSEKGTLVRPDGACHGEPKLTAMMKVVGLDVFCLVFVVGEVSCVGEDLGFGRR